MASPEVSIVIPVYNEKENIEEVFRRLQELFAHWKVTREVLFVDDGSSDGTSDILKTFPSRDPTVRVIRFARNFGQQAALGAGIRLAKGEIIVIIDSDLQVDPRDIPKLVDAINSGYDVVIGKRSYRAENLVTRRIPSWITNRFFSWYLNAKFEDIGCGLQAYRRKMVSGVDVHSTMHNHLPIYAVWRGARMTHVPVSYSPRVAGESKYSVVSLVYYFMDAVITFTNHPLQLAYMVLLGLALMAGGMLLGAWSLMSWLMHGSFGWISFVTMLLMLGTGIQCFIFGLINENVRRITARLDKTPNYIIDEIIEESPENEKKNS